VSSRKYPLKLNLNISGLATGGKYVRIPYGQLEAHISTFINPEHYPPTVTLKDPHSMPMEDIRTFLGYIQDREKKLGEYEAFRFSKYKDKTGFHDAAYPNSAAIPLAETRHSSPPIADELEVIPGLGTKAGYSRHVTQHQKSSQSGWSERQPGNTRGLGTDAAKPSDPLSLTNLNCPPAASVDPLAADSNNIIDQSTMGVLTGLGVPATIPVNGPSDGQPRYYMPPGGSGLLSEDNIDPRLLHISQNYTSRNH
jgi:hypothetical protein